MHIPEREHISGIFMPSIRFFYSCSTINAVDVSVAPTPTLTNVDVVSRRDVARRFYCSHLFVLVVLVAVVRDAL